MGCLPVVLEHGLAGFKHGFGIAFLGLCGDELGAGEEQAHQDQDDADHHEQFDHGESGAGSCGLRVACRELKTGALSLLATRNSQLVTHIAAY
jgi:hypothetical protein